MSCVSRPPSAKMSGLACVELGERGAVDGSTMEVVSSEVGDKVFGEMGCKSGLDAVCRDASVVEI